MTDNNRFFIYGRSSCSFCTAAINFCLALKKQFYFFDYEGKKADLDEIKIFYSAKTVPIILANDLDTGLT